MKLSIVGCVGVPGNYGGFETLADNLVLHLAEEHDITVYCSSAAYEEKIDNYCGAKLVYLPFKANGWQSIIYDLVSIVHSRIYKADKVLVLGVSSCFFFPLFGKYSRAKIIVNIDGLEWKRSCWSSVAKWYLKRSEQAAAEYSKTVVSDNEVITAYALKEYALAAKTIFYGGDNALRVSNSLNLEKVRSGIEYTDYAFSLCRIVPENNVEMIVKAFSISNQKLVFIGNWDNSVYGRAIKRKYLEYPNIRLLDPIYDMDLLFCYRSSCLYYVHGHSAGGTNPSLVEMMHFGKNIYAFDCEFNRSTTHGQANYFNNEKELLAHINNFESSRKTGEALKNIAEEHYTWEIIAEEYRKLFCAEC